jgi:UDP-N-acetylbacillosamine N-acetyltransferase
MKKKLVILGFGGHARSVADVALCCENLAFIDPSACEGENFLGHRVFQSLDSIFFYEFDGFAASGDGIQRQAQLTQLIERDIPIATLISPKATIGLGSNIASGCFIGHHAHVGPMAQVGQGSIINTGAILEHESSVGLFCHVSVNAAVAGRSHLGDFCFLGAGAIVIDRISIGSSVVVGAGGVVIQSLDQPGTYIGSPVRRLNQIADTL